MALVYSYKVNGARVATQGSLSNVVKEVDITVTGADGAAKFDLPTSLKLADADANSFIAFDQLAEAQIIGWVENDPALDGIKAHIAYVVAKEVEKLALESKPLPWAPAPEASAAPLTDVAA